MSSLRHTLRCAFPNPLITHLIISMCNWLLILCFLYEQDYISGMLLTAAASGAIGVVTN